MTRKHFIQIASILKEHKANGKLVRDIASLCASENQYFDYEKFYIACGVWE